MVTNIMAPKFSIIFRGLIRQASFPECWRSANITAIDKGAPSPNWENYRPISITPISSKVYEKLVSHKLSSFCEKIYFFPAAQYAYRKGLGCTDALLTISHHLHKSLDTGMESYIVQLDFSDAFERLSHSGSLLVYVAMCCPSVGSSSPTAGGESWFMVPLVSGSESFLVCHMKCVWVIFCSSLKDEHPAHQ